MERRLFLFGAGAALLSACTKHAPPLPPPPPPAPLHLRPLTELVAAPGLEWLVVVRVQEIVRASSLGKPISALLPAANLDKLADYLGFDVRLADSLVVAGYGATTLYLVDVPHDPAVVAKKLRDRITSDVEQASDGPSIARIGGDIGTQHRALVDFEQSVIALEVGKSGPGRAAIAFAEGKLKRSKPALRTEPLETLAKRLGDAPILAMAPTPAEHPWTKGAHGILARATAIGLAATPEPDGLHVRGLALGTWDDPPTVALHAMQKTLEDVVMSPLGHLAGLREPIVPPSFGGDRDAIHFEAVIDAEKLALGLRAATEAGISELFGRLRKKIAEEGKLGGGRDEGRVSAAIAPPGGHHERSLVLRARSRARLRRSTASGRVARTARRPRPDAHLARRVRRPADAADQDHQRRFARAPRVTAQRSKERKTVMTINAIGSSSTQIVTNSPEVSGGHHMTMAELQTWLAGRLDQMWGSVADITKDVDARTDAIKKAGSIKDDLAQGKITGAQAQAQLNALADSLPQDDAEDKQTLKGLAAQLGQADKDVTASTSAVLGAQQGVNAANGNYNALIQTAQAFGEAAAASSKADQEFADASSETQSKLTDMATSWDKQNSLAMTYLQQAMGEAQQAMATVSAIYKSVEDSAMGVIRNFG